MTKQTILIFLIGISLFLSASLKKLHHSHQHKHHLKKSHNPHDLLEEADYESFIQHFTFPFFDLNNILFGKSPKKESCTENNNTKNINIDERKNEGLNKNNNKENDLSKKDDILKQTKIKEEGSKHVPDCGCDNNKFYSDLNNDYIKKCRKNITEKKIIGQDKDDNSSLKENLKDVNKHLKQAKEQKPQKEAKKKSPIENTKAKEKAHIINNNLKTASPNGACLEEDENEDYRNSLHDFNIFKPYSFSKNTYDMNATEDSSSENFKALNGKKSFNKDSKNIAIARANNSCATAKSCGHGKAIARSFEGGQATAISLGDGEAVSEVKNNGKATAISYNNGKSVAKSHGKGISEAISKGDGKAVAISSDNSYSRAIAVGNSNSTALSSDNAIALSNANSFAHSDADAKHNSTSISNSTSKANSLAVATDNSFANATANANSVALSTASNNSVAQSNAISDAEALAKASGNGISQVLANANSHAVAESKDNSVVIVESNSESKSSSEAKGPEATHDGPNILIANAQNLIANKPTLKLRGSDLGRNHNYGSFLMIKKIELPRFNENQNMFDYLKLNLDDMQDGTALINTELHGGGGIFGLFKTHTDPIENSIPCQKANSNENNSTICSNIPNDTANKIVQAQNNNVEQTKQSIEALIGVPISKDTDQKPFFGEAKSDLNKDSCLTNPNNSNTYDKDKIIEANRNIDFSKMENQSDFVKDLIKKINNEDCILNYDAGPVFNTIVKKKEKDNPETPLENNCIDKNNISNQNILDENKNEDQGKTIQDSDNNKTTNEINNFQNASLNSENELGENCDNKSFLDGSANSQGNDQDNNIKDKNALSNCLPNGDGVNLDKENNAIIIDDPNNKNKKLKVNQSLNFSKNRINRNFNSQNSDFSAKSTIENLCDDEDKKGILSPEDESNKELNKLEGLEEDDNYDYPNLAGKKHRNKRKSKNKEPRKNKNKKYRSKRKRRSSDDGLGDIEDFDKQYFKSKNEDENENTCNKKEDENHETTIKDNTNIDEKPIIEADKTLYTQAPSEPIACLNEENKIPIIRNSISKEVQKENSAEEISKMSTGICNESNKDKIHSIWTNTKFKALDIACSNKGDIMAIGEDKKLYKYDIQNNTFEILKQEDELSNLVRIDLGSNATPFAITDTGNTYFLNSNSSWIRLPGCSTDISIGKNGEIFKLGCSEKKRGFSIYQLSCEIEEDYNKFGGRTKIFKGLDYYLRDYYANLQCNWTNFPGYAKSLIVGNDGLPYIISKKNKFVYKSDGIYWDAVSGIKAKDISISNENVLFIVGEDAKIYEIFNDKDNEVVLFDNIDAEKISTGPYSRPSIIKTKEGVVYTSSKI